MSPIPDFIDNYHLPPGEHRCTIDEIEQVFLFSQTRREIWRDFRSLLTRILTLNLIPEVILVDGSFVTGRELAGDVDGAILIRPEVYEAAVAIGDPHDIEGAMILFNPLNERAVRGLFGCHMLIAPHEQGLEFYSNLFQTGGQYGQLRDPDPVRDPAWVTRPPSKGILRVEGADIHV